MNFNMMEKHGRPILGVVLAGTMIVSGMAPTFAASTTSADAVTSATMATQGGNQQKAPGNGPDLSALVTAGTITSDQKTAIDAALQAGRTSKTTMVDTLKALVTAGTITSDQEAAVEKAIAPPSGSGGGNGTAPADSGKGMDLSALVTAGTITSDQKIAVETALKDGMTSKTSLKDTLAAIVTAGTITAAQQTAIEAALAPPSGTNGGQNKPADGTATSAVPVSAPTGLSMVINGKAVSATVSPYVDQNSRTMVELRTIAEALGATLEWDNATRTATLTANGKIVKITIDQTAYTVDGEQKTMDTSAVIKSGHTMVPVRVVSEALGAAVSYDGTTKTVTITQ